MRQTDTELRLLGAYCYPANFHSINTHALPAGQVFLPLSDPSTTRVIASRVLPIHRGSARSAVILKRDLQQNLYQIVNFTVPRAQLNLVKKVSYKPPTQLSTWRYGSRTCTCWADASAMLKNAILLQDQSPKFLVYAIELQELPNNLNLIQG